jgi:hypothetical protein
MRVWLRCVAGMIVMAGAVGQTLPSAVTPLPGSAIVAGKVGIVEGTGVLEITVEGKAFTSYRFAETAGDPHWQRPYFWPVRAADGTEVTSDQTRERITNPKADHPHHRSIWVGWGDVNGANHWSASKEKERHVKFDAIGPDGFVEELTWDKKGGEGVLLKEVRRVKVVVFGDGTRGLEIESALTAADEDAVFACKPLNVTGVEAGLCAVRMATGILAGKAEEKWITSEAPAVGEAEARVKPALWCDYSGILHGEKYGVAMVAGKENVGSPGPWHVREFGLMADIGPLNWTLKKGETRRVKHLVIVHEGDAAGSDVGGKAAAWAAE